MRDSIRNLEAKMMVKGQQLLAPLKNRSALDDNANKGISGTVGLVIVLVLVALAVVIALVVVAQGNKGIDKTRGFFDNLWTSFETIK